MSVWLITRLTFLEAQRRKLLWAVLLMGIIFLALFGIGFYFMYQDFVRYTGTNTRQFAEISSGFLLIGLYVVNFLGVVLAILISVDTIAGEISSGTIQTVITKPLRRWQVIIGKWLGLAIMLSLFIALMSAALIGITWRIAHFTPRHAGEGVALMVLSSLIVLTLSILGGTRLSTLANGVVVFMAYGTAFVAGWMEQIGAFLHNAAAVDIGIAVSLLIPAEATWKRAAYLMQPPSIRDLPVSPFSSASAPSPAMVLYALLYIVVTLAIALRLFQRRDL